MKLKGYLLILAAAVLWAMIGPVSRIAFDQGVTPMEVAFWRAAISSLLFGAHAAAIGEVRMERRDLPWAAFFGLFGIAVFFACNHLTIRNGGVALASVLLYTAPAWVAIISRIFLNEALTPVKLLALVLTIIGVAGVSLGGGSGRLNWNATAVLFGVISGFCYSFFYVLGRHFAGRYSSPNLFLYVMPVGAIGLLPWVKFVQKTPTAWTALLILSLCLTYGAYRIYYEGMKYLESTHAAIVATLEPVVAALVAYLWWNEVFTPTGYLGAALILVSVVLIVVDGARRPEGRRA